MDFVPSMFSGLKCEKRKEEILKVKNNIKRRLSQIALNVDYFSTDIVTEEEEEGDTKNLFSSAKGKNRAQLFKTNDVVS